MFVLPFHSRDLRLLDRCPVRLASSAVWENIRVKLHTVKGGGVNFHICSTWGCNIEFREVIRVLHGIFDIDAARNKTSD